MIGECAGHAQVLQAVKEELHGVLEGTPGDDVGGCPPDHLLPTGDPREDLLIQAADQERDRP
jgi:hypothetical protein